MLAALFRGAIAVSIGVGATGACLACVGSTYEVRGMGVVLVIASISWVVCLLYSLRLVRKPPHVPTPHPQIDSPAPEPQHGAPVPPLPARAAAEPHARRVG